MDKLKQLESFVSVATRGSLTAAAKAEGVAPAIMGRRLDALEERLGVKLLVRTTRRITLDPRGQRLPGGLPAPAGRPGQCRGQRQRRRRQGQRPPAHHRAGRLRPPPRGAAGAASFRELHADVTISLNLSDRVVDLAGEGYDCAVRVGDLPDSSLVSVRLADNRRLCVATPRLPASGTARRSIPNDLVEVRLPHAVQRRLADARLGLLAARQGRRATRSSTSSRPARWTAPTARCCTTGACRAGASPGAAPGRWSSEIAAGRLVEVLADFAAPPNGIYAVFPQRKHLPLRVRLWIDFLKHHYSQPAVLDGGPAMTLEALLAYAHLLAILTLVVFISSEAALCRPEWMNANDRSSGW